jgi:hypothetical protein
MIQSFIFGLSQTISIVTIVAAAVVLATLIIVIVVGKRAGDKRRVTREAKNQTYIKDGVKYTHSDAVLNADGSVRVTKNEADVVLRMGKTYRAARNGYLLPGKYKVLSSGSGEERFYIRLGNFVREYSHGDEIIVASSEEITAVSHSVVLR